MRLRELIEGMTIREFQGDQDPEISGIAYDSRRVRPGNLFVALRGHRQDGHAYIGDAVSRGAAGVVSELPLSPDGGEQKNRLPMIQVPDARRALSRLAVRFFDAPFKTMNLIGITGTNGKTTTAYLLESILVAAGKQPGIIGTINYRFSGQVLEAPVTTPESLDLMQTLRRMKDSGVTDVVMEVSSHSLDQGRVRDCPFQVAVFTNLSRDHLDYHRSMEAYFEAKARLFRSSGQREEYSPAHAVINVDDPKGRELIRLTKAGVTTYGVEGRCQIRADDVHLSRGGLKARLITPAGEIDIVSPLIGAHDIYNIMAAAGAALATGIDLNAIASGLGRLTGVPGRLEMVRNRRALAIVVDYAHTPDALLKALNAVRLLTTGRVITVFGCGGDRDRGKRREMGRVAGMGSDRVFITSDNPRTEDPAAIAAQIEKGVIESGIREYVLDLDREQAIRRAVKMADRADAVLIAGKGHETYQIIGHEKRPFDDRLVAAEAANESGDG
ncbi:MAG: UDP-N-acetylmuramoyl-L-alanyl-D-glutamate--2,6-diaminopimelate ligase [Deltaproteobacteria bacterium]|nr:UDP-N-acetylmuramoyl-L-alanyl-D-glutamate--2,6-diaminopimelate ligase [Deltaproteobacteria bacterium]